jgi:hypothetical protein
VDIEKDLMEQILAGLKDVQTTNLQILERVTSIEERVTSIEENHVELTDRLSNFQVQTNQNFARLDSKVNTVILTMQLMTYTYEAIAQDHGQHAKFLLALSKRISVLEKKLNNQDEVQE